MDIKVLSKLIVCPHCDMEQKLENCVVHWQLHVLVKLSTSPPQKFQLNVYNQVAQNLAAMANVNAQTCDKTTLSSALLDLPKIKITYNPMQRRMLDVEHVEEQNL